MIVRRRPLGIGLAGAIGGLGFSSTYDPRTIAIPVVVAAAVPVVIATVQDRWPKLATWRLLLVLALLLTTTVLTITGGTAPGQPLVASAFRGVVDGWRQTLDLGAGVRATLGNAAWLPMLVGALTFVGCEIEARSPPWALVPATLLLAAGQRFKPLPGMWAVAVGASFALAILLALVEPNSASECSGAATPGAAAWTPSAPRRRLRPHVSSVIVVVLASVGATYALTAHPGARSPQRTSRAIVVNPLDLVPTLLKQADTPLFDVRPNAGYVGPRWRLAVLDTFDGNSWGITPRYHPMGPIPLDAAARDERTERGIATVHLRSGLLEPWLPTGGTPTGVDGDDITGDASTGTLAAAGGRGGYSSKTYRVAFATPIPTAPLASYPVARLNPPQASLVPVDLRELALSIVGNGPPDFSAVQAIENYLRGSYTLAGSGSVPGGHSVTNVANFLSQTRKGTSEQFATAFALLARAVQIPVRIVVGVRVPAPSGFRGQVTVRGRDVLAWPEVRFDKIGWIPFDPTPPASGTNGRSLSAVDKPFSIARTPQPVTRPSATPVSPSTRNATPPVVRAVTTGRNDAVSAWWLAAGALTLLLAGGVGTPAVLETRRRRRRRTQPDPADSVCGAWRDVIDALRDYRLLGASPTAPRQVLALADQLPLATRDHVQMFVGPLDDALWGTAPVPRAVADAVWRSADAIRKELRSRPLARLRATVSRPARIYRRAETRGGSRPLGSRWRRFPSEGRGAWSPRS